MSDKPSEQTIYLSPTRSSEDMSAVSANVELPTPKALDVADTAVDGQYVSAVYYFCELSNV